MRLLKIFLAAFTLALSSCYSLNHNNNATRGGDDIELEDVIEPLERKIEQALGLGAVGISARRNVVYFHERVVLDQFNSEPNGFELYTYVLLPHRGELSEESAAARYSAILTAIDATTRAYSEKSVTPSEREKTNIFCMFEPSDYSHLDRRYIDLVRYFFSNEKQIIQALETQIGPFLVSMRIPLGRLERLPFLIDQIRDLKATNYRDIEQLRSLNRQLTAAQRNLDRIKGKSLRMLFVNLSDTHPAAMREVVATYKTFLINNTSTVTEESQLSMNSMSAMERKLNGSTSSFSFDPLRLRLLNFILNADENIRIVKEAVAGWVTIPNNQLTKVNLKVH